MLTEEAITFGGWVKQRRKALDCTQEHLADYVGCAAETIRKIESGRRRPSRQMVELLASQFGVPSTEWPMLVQFARVDHLPEQPKEPLPVTSTHSSKPGYSTGPGNLPVYLTTFVGREAHIDAIGALIQRSDVRLLTLTGPGGTGKTRLAVEVANSLAGKFSDGVRFISLASVTEPSLVTSVVAPALGIRVGTGSDLVGAIKVHLHNKNLLIVLDNFEHVMRAAFIVSQLLENAPLLKVLVTSRESLHLYGEQEYAVPPLSLPDARQGMITDEAVNCESVELFVRRAKATRPDFSLTAENRLAVTEICRRVDGLPLAIELVVSRMSVLPPRAILARMDSSLNMLTGGPRNLPARQQALRSTIDWSYQRLNNAEKKLFYRLAAFADGFTLGAAEAVCTSPGKNSARTLEVIESLIDKSLLIEFDGQDGEPRFTMLNTVREFARERLLESVEAEAVLSRCALFYLHLAEAVEKERASTDYEVWLDRLEAEHQNILAALQWCRQGGDIELGLRLAVALTRFWYVRGYIDLAFEEFILALDVAHPLPPSINRAQAFLAAGEAALEQERVVVALHLFEAGLADARKLGDKRVIAGALVDLGCSSYLMGECKVAQGYLEEGLWLMREDGNPGGIAVALLHLGEAMRCQGDPVNARSFYIQSVKQYRQGAGSGLAFCLYKFGNLEFGQGGLDAAQCLYRESLTLSSKLKYKLCIAASLLGLAAILVSSRESEAARRAAVLFGASERLLEDSQLHLAAYDRPDCEARKEDARALCGHATWEQAWDEGRSMPVENVITFAMEGWPRGAARPAIAYASLQ